MLSKQEITQTLASKGLTALDLNEYKNLDTLLHLVCNNGHHIEASLRAVRNDKFICPVCDGAASSSEKISGRMVPNKKGYRIVALDNASNNAGVSVYDNGKLVFYHLFHFEGNTIVRLLKNRTLLEDTIIAAWKPDLVVVEDIQYQTNIQTFKTLAMLLGNTLVSLQKAGIRHETVLSKVWRSHLMIGGKTRLEEKANAIAKVHDMYGLTVSDDIAEAILIGKYAVDCVQKTTTKKLF